MKVVYAILIVLALLAQSMCAAIVLKRTNASISLTTVLSEEIHEEDGDLTISLEIFGTPCVQPRQQAFAQSESLPILHIFEGPGDPPEFLV